MSCTQGVDRHPAHSFLGKAIDRIVRRVNIFLVFGFFFEKVLTLVASDARL
jgi:hypothetical protein